MRGIRVQSLTTHEKFLRIQEGAECLLDLIQRVPNGVWNSDEERALIQTSQGLQHVIEEVLAPLFGPMEHPLPTLGDK